MPAKLDNLDPEMDQSTEMDAPADEPTDAQPAGDVIGTHGESDREGAMAKADLFKLANYAHKLYEKLEDDDQLEAWVQAKITKAADYVASVYHYLEYEMKFSEYGHHLDNSDTLSEGQKMKIKELLAEAKNKMKDLKKSQAEKMKDKDSKKVEEGILSGGHKDCHHCGGSGKVYEEPKQVPSHVQSKVKSYNRMVNAVKAAHTRMEKENEPMDEEFTDKSKVGDSYKTKRGGTVTKTEQGQKHIKGDYDDEEYKAPPSPPKSHAKARSAADKAGDKAADKAQEKDSKDWEKKYPGTVTKVVAGKKVDPNAPKKKKSEDDDLDENMYGQGVYEAKSKMAKKDYDKDGKIESGKDEYLGSRIRAAKKAGKLKEAVKMCKECNMAMAECSCKSVKEGAKPSAGLSKAKKSATVKKAKAGGDIGKPGKGFDKLAKKAGGGEKGEKIAAAAMWKNIKETTAYIAEKAKATKPDYIDLDKDGDKSEPMKKAAADKKKETVKESTDLNRLRELTGRLNQSEKPALVENREVDQIRALTKRLLG